MKFDYESVSMENPCDSCMSWIYEYFKHEPIGYPVLVNTENFSDYYLIRENLRSFQSKNDCREKLYFFTTSDLRFQNSIGLPVISKIKYELTRKKEFCLSGLSFYLMLLCGDRLTADIIEFRDLSILGHGIILLYHCQSILQEFIRNDPRLENRILLVSGEPSDFPRIVLSKNDTEVPSGSTYYQDFGKLFDHLDQLGRKYISSKEDEIYFITNKDSSYFSHNYFNVSLSLGSAGRIFKIFNIFDPTHDKPLGTEKQWDWFSEKCVACESFESTVKRLLDWSEDKDEISKCTEILSENRSTSVDAQNKIWLLWLIIKKIPGFVKDPYLSYCVLDNNDYKDLWHQIYRAILDIEPSRADFKHYFASRKKILKQLEELSALDHREMQLYCDLVKTFPAKKAICYLTSLTEEELDCVINILSKEECHKIKIQELIKILDLEFIQLSKYLDQYTFDENSTWFSRVSSDNNSCLEASENNNVTNDGNQEKCNVSQNNSEQFIDTSIIFNNCSNLLQHNPWAFLTNYFTLYRFQKLTNYLDPTFLNVVQKLATERLMLFKKLKSRATLLHEICDDCRRNNIQILPYFLDAMGVEFLPYIQSNCKKFGLDCEIKIGHCALPSITKFNKEFEELFENKATGKPLHSCYRSLTSNGNLDHLKHTPVEINNQKTGLPKHIFSELSVIDKYLRDIRVNLEFEAEKSAEVLALLFSDHGASRLAVLFDRENSYEMHDKTDGEAKCSGRCCFWSDEVPDIKCAVYESQIENNEKVRYAALANYERFKGTRASPVEVHGGASLEECLVPVIILRLSPSGRQYRFESNEIRVRPCQTVQIKLICTVAMRSPRIKIGNKLLKGTLSEKSRNTAIFEIPSSDPILKNALVNVSIYEGDSDTGIKLDIIFSKMRTKMNDIGI